MADKIAERSDDRLTIEIYYAGELGYSGFELHRVASEGLLEMGQTVTAAFAELPVFQILDQYIYNNQRERMLVYNAIKSDMDKAAETMNLKFLGGWAWPMTNWFSTVKLATVDDFKGAKLRTWNPVLTKYLEGMGAAAVTCDYAEMYTAMSTGVIEGTMNQVISMYEMKFYEVCPYQNYWPMPSAFYVNFTNLDAFNDLPPDVQDILLQAANDAAAECQRLLFEPDGQLFKERLQFFVEYVQEQVYPSETELE